MSADELWESALSGTDREWFIATGHCGGCGDEASTCHPGKDCNEVPDKGWVGHSICGHCQLRRDQGLLS